MVKQGIFISVSGATFICFSHSKEDVDKTLNALEKTCEFIVDKVKNENYGEFIEGELPKKIWSMKIPSIKKHLKQIKYFLIENNRQKHHKFQKQ